MKKNYLLLSLIVLMISCEKDGISPEEEATTKENLQEIPFDKLPSSILKDLDREIFKQKSEGNSLFGDVRRDIAVKKITDESASATYTFVLAESNSNSDKASSGLYFDNLVLIKGQDGENEMLVIRYEPTEAWYNESRDFQNYSGQITFFTSQGEEINSMRVSSGKMIKEKESLKGAMACYYELAKTEILYTGSEGSMDSGYVATIIYTYEKKCVSVGGGGGSGDYGDTDGPREPGSIPTVPTGPDFDWDYGGGNGSPSFPEPEEEEEEEIMIEINVQLEDKELCAYNRLVYAGVNATNYVNLMTELFVEFGEGNIGDADLIITERDLGHIGGQSFITDEGEFEIVISRMGERSSIEIAAVLIHEMAHAFLAKHYSLYNSSFQELYAKYINEHGLNNFSHDIMKDQFIEKMGQVLYDYDSSLFPDFDDYKTLASYGVYEFDEDQLEAYKQVRNFAFKNDIRCNDEK